MDGLESTRSAPATSVVDARASGRTPHEHRPRQPVHCYEQEEVLIQTLLDTLRAETPDAVKCRAALGAVIGVATQRGREHAYSEIVDVLWRNGHLEAAVRLADWWNALTREHLTREHEVMPLAHRPPSLERESTTQRTSLEAQLVRNLSLLQARDDALRVALGRHAELVALEHDARVEAEHATRAAEHAKRAKAEFLAVMSHELRTPLNAIGGYAELLELGVHGPITTEQRGALERVKRNQRHLLALIDDVLNYTRLESKTVCYAMGDVAVDEMLRRVGTFILPQLTAKRLHYEYRGCDGALTVSADDDRLQQIIVSVVTNAVKFSDEGGRVWIECDADGAAVHIHVRDTGVGIPADKLEAIFDPFVQVDTSYTRTRDGVGLGLAISRDLARGMGGDLTVESVEGRGSSFTLSLPRPAR